VRGLHAEVADVVGGRFVETFQECDLQCARGDAGMRGEFGRSEVSAQVLDNPILHHLERDRPKPMTVGTWMERHRRS
jgi:hypothetical protein